MHMYSAEEHAGMRTHMAGICAHGSLHMFHREISSGKCVILRRDLLNKHGRTHILRQTCVNVCMCSIEECTHACALDMCIHCAETCMNVHTYHREKELDAERQSKGCQVSVEAQDKVDLVKRYRWTPGGDLEQSLVTYNGKHSALIYRRKKGCQVSVEAQEKDLLVIRQGRDEVRGER